MKMPLVSIIIPNFNGGTKLADSCKSILRLDYPQSRIEIYVVDNNSTDGSDKRIKKLSSKIRLIKLTRNNGFSHAVNYGIAKAKGDYIFIGNNDISFGKTSLRLLVNTMESTPHVAVAGGTIFSYKEKRRILSAGHVFNKWTGAVGTATGGYRLKDPDWIQGCALVVKSSTLCTIGTLDEGYDPFYFEDLDFCTRAKKKGYRIAYVPNAHFWHDESSTINKYEKVKNKMWYKNKIRFAFIHLPILQIASITVCQVLIAIVYLLQGNNKYTHAIKGITTNLWDLKDIIFLRKKYEQQLA